MWRRIVRVYVRLKLIMTRVFPVSGPAVKEPRWEETGEHDAVGGAIRVYVSVCLSCAFPPYLVL